jgi:hypothetical protein
MGKKMEGKSLESKREFFLLKHFAVVRKDED